MFFYCQAPVQVQGLLVKLMSGLVKIRFRLQLNFEVGRSTCLSGLFLKLKAILEWYLLFVFIIFLQFPRLPVSSSWLRMGTTMSSGTRRESSLPGTRTRSSSAREDEKAGSWEKKIWREKETCVVLVLCFVVRRLVLEGSNINPSCHQSAPAAKHLL